MKKYILLSLACASLTYAQTKIVPVTLTAAVNDSRTTTVALSSTTICVQTGSPCTLLSYSQPPGGVQVAPTSFVLAIDRELMDVRFVNGLVVTVRRGAGGTTATPHANGSLVFAAPPQFWIARDLQTEAGGGCLRGGLLGAGTTTTSAGSTALPGDYLPKFNAKTGIYSDCLGGVWTNGIVNPWLPTNSKFSIPFPEPGAVAYTGIGGTGTAPVAGTLNCTEINLPYNKLITNIAILNGTTVGTDNHLVALYDSSGNLLANSAPAGVLAANASTYQNIALTSPFFAIGPARYFACSQSNGTTATIRMVAAGTQDNVLTKAIAGTFGTIPATIVVPTTFTTAVGPYFNVN